MTVSLTVTLVESRLIEVTVPLGTVPLTSVPFSVPFPVEFSPMIVREMVLIAEPSSSSIKLIATV